jgi:hypothetical protein
VLQYRKCDLAAEAILVKPVTCADLAQTIRSSLNKDSCYCWKPGLLILSALEVGISFLRSKQQLLCLSDVLWFKYTAAAATANLCQPVVKGESAE